MPSELRVGMELPTDENNLQSGFISPNKTEAVTKMTVTNIDVAGRVLWMEGIVPGEQRDGKTFKRPFFVKPFDSRDFYYVLDDENT